MQGGIVISSLQFMTPPLPFYLTSHDDTFAIGQSHANRNQIGVFDLIVVTEGCLHMAEETANWDVPAGHALLLRPDLSHRGTKPCTEETRYFWLHFQAAGEWSEVPTSTMPECSPFKDGFTPIRFSIMLPRFFKLSSPPLIYEKLRQLKSLERLPLAKSRWRQQLLFQETLLELSKEHTLSLDLAAVQVAERVATYIRENFRSNISYKELGETFNFHPAYVARCIKRVFDCTPLEYLINCRIQQAKRYLMNSNLPVGQIAEEVGFANVSYFIRTFSNAEGMTPSKFRKSFRS